MAPEIVTVQSGPLKGRQFTVSGVVSIGRGVDNTIQLNDLEVSRRHAVIEQTPAGTLLRDLGSGNGTFVGTRRVEEFRLSPGDTIRIGPIDLVYDGPQEGPITDESVMGSGWREPGSGVRFESGEIAGVQAESADEVYQTLFQSPAQQATSDQIRTLQERLRAVYEANQLIASERDLDQVFERVLDQVFQLVPAHNGVILLKPEQGTGLRTACVKAADENQEFKVSSTIVNRAMDNNEAIVTFDAAGDGRFQAEGSIIAHNIASVMCAPLKFQDEVLGVIYADTRGATNAFNQGDLELLVAIAGPAAIAIKNAQYLSALERAYHDTLIALANAIELRDHYTVGHTWRVTNFALETARELGWDDAKLRECEMGGVLHDIGKIAIDDAILRKPDRLTDEEYAKMQVHPERGARMMQDINFLLPLIPYALYHHERYDGKGYPHGLAGEDIPIEGRLLAVADTFDAMTSNRPYRKGLDPEVAIATIEKGKGTQFDPDIADAFLAAYRDGRIARILQDYHKGERSIACPFCSTYVRVEEDMAVGAEFDCGVCRRRLSLRVQNDAYYAELLSATDVRTPAPTVEKPAEST